MRPSAADSSDGDDERLFREIDHPSRHLLAVQKTLLAEFATHARRKPGKLLEDGLEALHAAEIREDAPERGGLKGRRGRRKILAAARDQERDRLGQMPWPARGEK